MRTADVTPFSKAPRSRPSPGFPTTLAHLAVTLAAGAGATLYILLTPWKEIALIREGNTAAAVALGGVLVGLAMPLAASPQRLDLAARTSLVWGVATVVLQLLVFRLVDLMLHGLPQRIQEGEIAAAVAAGRRQAGHRPDPRRRPVGLSPMRSPPSGLADLRRGRRRLVIASLRPARERRRAAAAADRR